MQLRALLSLSLALPLLLVLYGCDGDDTSASDTHADHGTETGAATDCEAEDRDDEFAIGLSKTGTAVMVTFVAADPAPPAIGDNTWTVSVTDPGGQPLDNTTITNVLPFMPDHGHGTADEAVATPTANAGEFTITPLNLFMAGLWEVTLDLDVGGTSDQVKFSFCLE